MQLIGLRIWAVSGLDSFETLSALLSSCTHACDVVGLYRFIQKLISQS